MPNSKIPIIDVVFLPSDMAKSFIQLEESEEIKSEFESKSLKLSLFLRLCSA